MTVPAQLIVLHTTKFGESSLVVHTISNEYGRRSFLVRGLGRSRGSSRPASYGSSSGSSSVSSLGSSRGLTGGSSRNSSRGTSSGMAMFLPMNILEADIVESSKSDLYTAKNIASKYPLTDIRNNVRKNAITLFLSEVLYRTVRTGQMEPGLFEWCEKNILLLDAMQTDFSNFHIRFLLELTVILGFSPTPADFAPFTPASPAASALVASAPVASPTVLSTPIAAQPSAGRVAESPSAGPISAPSSAEPVAASPSAPSAADGNHFEILAQFLTSSFTESMLIPLSGRLRNALAEDILHYIEFHTESALNINSLRVLRELFI